MPAILTALIAGSAVVSAYDTWASLDAVGGDGDSSQKARALADGVALMMTSVHYGMYACIACAGLLLGLTWRYRWSKGSAPEAPTD